MKRDYRVYLDDIIGAIEKIEKYINGLTFDEFSRDEKTIDSVIRNFEIIGEAAKNVPEEIRQEYPKIPWKEMAGMRDKLIHEYFGVKIEVVWETIKKRLPNVKALSKKALEEMGKEI
ncbi:MAG: hypothetical protein FD145_1213 [Candidatus Saganbacteria bacterium]|uniref:DUF86 domain-containing protein n=1 Tax=Candidatus Saganbacteria bacterium TaxID=2575572 RepID=A0A833L0B4_UNCSA|nr:MAG: hypothetical protein FD145_1213 [Candidatus Saganbacteria bacterium]